MLLPTQQTFGLAATNMMRSMLDSIEEQRKKDEEQRTGKKSDPIVEARISASEDARRARDKITSALFGVNKTDPNELKIELVDRLATKLGIDTDEARSSYKLGKALEDALKEMMPDEVGKLAEDLGLDDIGISMDTLLAAIKNPYGDDNQRLMDGLNRKANGGKLDTEVERVVQRLEDVADPKTLEELKLGPQGYDPTRVEDAGTRAERQADIQAAEAGKKLEDVQKVQDVIEKTNDKATAAPAADGTGDTPAVDDTALLALFAAAAEQVANTDTDDAGDSLVSDDQSAKGDSVTDEVLADNEAPTNEMAASAIEELAADSAEKSQADIFSVRVDEIGIYELLKKKLAA
ncbi:Hypothetical protein RG1141_CH42180 [Neorhizobium galegae bv. officinalis bv. officinalis str. HAMBI 1141]|uniref:Uncharacterized protein n=1 Tax=Neorhizobium galegae bv. officinalis bv. officinalis str. HAMBI 1141 TaxID=1028801 RepID=A0A068TEP9_NEOGA|nr:hypothetical protein [Neorhizobium galegae]CDN56531.1 Hypothetical protein RG1141_CH42180 [Neorhizobium galegae bv. officinalis bv. officinalis str. HAMBI 1141]